MTSMNKIFVAALVGMAGSVAGQSSVPVLNSSFETAGAGGNEVFQNWLNFNGPNILPVTNIDPPPGGLGVGPVNSGNISAQIFGNFDGNDNTPVLFQSIATPISQGDEFECAVQVAQVADDLLMEPASAFIAIVYIDSVRPDGGAANIIDFQTQVSDLTGDPAEFQRLAVSGLAPFDVEEIQILFGYNQPVATEDMNGDMVIDGADQATGAVYLDDAEVALLSQGNEVPFRGGSFEEPNPFGNAYWGFTDFDAGFNFQRLSGVIDPEDLVDNGSGMMVPANDQNEDGIPDGALIDAFDGEFVASTFGQFNGSQNDSVFYQDIVAVAGESYEASVQVANVSGDALQPGVRAFMTVTFRDDNGDEIFEDMDGDGVNDLLFDVFLADDTTEQDQWLERSVMSGPAPSEAARVRVTYVFQQDADEGAGQAGGALRLDAMQFGLPMAADFLCADQNRDGMLAGDDFNAWLLNFLDSDLIADVNQDGMLAGDDFNAWLLAFLGGEDGPRCP